MTIGSTTKPARRSKPWIDASWHDPNSEDICPVIVPADRYFVERPGASHDFTNYWEPREDPDGVVRDRSTDEERLRYLEDVADEMVFVRELGPDSLVDVGCGPGWFLSDLEARKKVAVEPSHQPVAGLDGWYDSVEHCLIMERVESFDIVRCHHVIEHMTNPSQELIWMRRLLKRGGWLLLSTPDFGGPCAARFGDRYRMLHDKTHCSLFTNESCHRFLRDHGFTIEWVKYPFPEKDPGEAFTAWIRETICPPFPGNWMTFYARKK